jgi:hypothetical protein
VSIIDRTRFENEPKGVGFIGAVQLGSRLAKVHVRSSGETEKAWNHAELILAYLQGQMNCVEEAVRDLLLRLDGFSEDTPKGRRKIERLLSQVSESNIICVIQDDRAFVYLDQPRLTDHFIELQFRSGAKLVSATIAG